MPLNAAGLQTDLTSLAASPPPSIAGCAAAWASAMQSYAAGVVPPSTAVAAAASTLQAALASAFATPAAAPGMENAFKTFATTVGGGMAPAFVATPPAGAVGFAAQFALAHPATHSAAAAALRTKIDTWMRTGTAVPSGGGAAAPWS